MKNNMEEKLITFETAVLAKEKGFESFTNWAYLLDTKDGETLIDDGWEEIMEDNPEIFKFIGYAPTQSLLQKWLREVHNILIYVDPRSHHIFQYHIITDDDEIIGSDRLNNWELILEKGLQEALKLIENE